MEFDNPLFEDDPEDIETSDADPTRISISDDTGTRSIGDNTTPLSLQQELLNSSVDDYYNALARRGLTPAAGRDYNQFELVAGKLRLKAYPNLDLTHFRTGEPVAFSTLAGHRGGGAAIREGLGFVDWQRRPPTQARLPANTVVALRAERDQLAMNVESIELSEIGQVASRASVAVQRMETALTDANIDDILGTVDDPPLDLRELRGLDRALQRVRGELTNNLAKLSELDAHVEREKEKLADAEDGGLDDHIKQRIADRLRELREERSARLEAASANRKALASQINRIRETIDRILHEDTTLAERIRTLFREQGITIASILTAIGMAISTLVLALTGRGTAAPPAPTPAPQPPGPGPQPPSGGLKEWLKEHLKALGRVLARLAGKAAAALPGIIGTVVSWLLNLLSKGAELLAEHLWAMAIALGGLLLIAAREWLETSKRP